MKVIIPTGYMGSGSSAITDLASEYSECSNLHKSYEYVFLHCPNGLFDLEDKLLTGNNALRSDEALRTFENQMERLYRSKLWWVGNYKNIIGDEFIKLTRQFIESIEQFRFKGYWYTHEEIDCKMFFKLIARKPIKKLFPKLQLQKVLRYNDGMRISFIDEESFYDAAKTYIRGVFKAVTEDADNVIMDQLVLPFNLHRIDNYFDDYAKVVVVQRDPRDVFFINKYVWVNKGCQIPVPTDVYQFCDFYEKMRKSEKKTYSEKVLRINFEDLIYKYNETVKKFEDFIGFTDNDHERKFSRFNPDLSIRNTQVFRNDNFIKENMIIEGKLTKYLYDFPKNMDNNISNTIEFE